MDKLREVLKNTAIFEYAEKLHYLIKDDGSFMKDEFLDSAEQEIREYFKHSGDEQYVIIDYDTEYLIDKFGRKWVREKIGGK